MVGPVEGDVEQKDGRRPIGAAPQRNSPCTASNAAATVAGSAPGRASALIGIGAPGQPLVRRQPVWCRADRGEQGHALARPGDVEDTRQISSVAAGEIFALALRLGGTLTGEHGVGVLKRQWVADELGPAANALQRRLREAFDPRGILTPGKTLRLTPLTSSPVEFLRSIPSNRCRQRQGSRSWSTHTPTPT